jgi:hypothetical protein
MVTSEFIDADRLVTMSFEGSRIPVGPESSSLPWSQFGTGIVQLKGIYCEGKMLCL